MLKADRQIFDEEFYNNFINKLRQKLLQINDNGKDRM